MSGTWSERAWDVINKVDTSLPDDVSVTDRIKAIDDAYPFGLRKHHPYKMWLKARRKYLDRYRGPKHHTPLEEAINEANTTHREGLNAS